MTGGSVRICQVLLDHARASGVNCFCVNLNRALAEQGVNSIIVPAGEDMSGKAIRDSLDADRPDIVHIHGIWLGGQHAASVWARRHGVPVVWSTHGMTAPWALRHKRWKKMPAWFAYQRHDLQKAALLHATTETEAEWNCAVGLRPPQIVVPLGTEEKLLQADARLDPETVPKVLFVGRIHPVKGLLNLVMALALAKNRLEGRDVRLRIVGPDEGGHRAVVEAACRREAVTELVDFAGPKFGSDLSAEYAACDILVLPNFTENFGAVVVDALAHGKPVIASRFTPWHELETEGCGWWVENSPESLAEALVRAVRTPLAARAEMGSRGRRLVAARYSWSAVAQRMLEGYRKVLKQA